MHHIHTTPPSIVCRSTRSSLHFDPYQNLLCVVAGSKRVWLAPPSITPHLDPQPVTAESANHSPADLSHPDPHRFPGLSEALAGRLQVFELGPGDALYIPEGWWHQASRVADLAGGVPGGLPCTMVCPAC